MISVRELEAHFADLPPELLDIVVELRNLVAEIAPQACEEVRSRGLVYHYAGGGPVSAGICGIHVERDHVRLYFTQGAFIPDPHGRLVDEGRKAMRFVRIESFDSAPWDDLRALIESHARFNPYTQTFRSAR
ncbi:uncharacterized conserved protein [Longilinea arvoryzae]|uniref:Uncharacterized conserved protein n=1 Tax=Longilinea arvoryzae TaxID=360412 RepID=A0A0S7BHM7_9CHLR|nr:DUF1801 domain-containing protein [Longilinea arvoryzae]GAP13034.1 uncharacterized conserved protein [Longilinea arvoryzae]